jgi:peptide/nickel transport system substrate-binding protein
VNYAVDVDAIIKNVLGGQGTRVAAGVASHIFGYNPDIKPYSYDPNKAKQLLTEAGYANGFSTTMDTPNGRYIKDKEVAQAVAGYLDKVGIKVEVNTKEWGLYSQDIVNRTVDPMFLIGWGGGGTFDADTILNTQFRSDDYHSYYANPKVDQLLDDARSTLDQDKRLADYKQIEQILFQDAPWLFLYVQQDVWGLKKNVNWGPRADEGLQVFEASISG